MYLLECKCFFIEFRRWDMNDKARYTYLCRKEQLYKSRMLKNILICMIKTKYNLENQNVGEGAIYNDTKHI